MNTPLTRAEHVEFAKRMEEEHTRLNHRVKEVEDVVKQINNLTISIQKLASSMENMLKEQEKQGERLEELEGRDGEMWRKATGYIVTSVISIFITYLFTQVGM